MKRIPLISILLLSLLQGANMLIPFLDSHNAYTQFLIENEENERSCKEDSETIELYAFLNQSILPACFLSARNQYLSMDVTPSNSYLTKPETPPPNI